MMDSLDDELAGLRGLLTEFPSPPGGPAIPQRLTAAGARLADEAAAEHRWSKLEAQSLDLAGARVLLIGDHAAADAERFAAHAVGEVVVCGPQGPISVSSGDADAPHGDAPSASGWRSLDVSRHGSFDLVHCDHQLNRVPDPMALLETMRALLADTGVLLLLTMTLASPEHSEYLRFAPDRVEGGTSFWFIPGRLALRWMMATAGFDVAGAFGEDESTWRTVPVVSGYLRATRRTT